MIDVKKLITGFLILAATAAVSAGFILSPLSGTFAQSAAPTNSQIIINGAPAGDTSGAAISTSTASTNAFLPAPPEDDGHQIDYSGLALVSTSSDDGNLTDVLADAFMNGVVQSNPTGPQDDGTGNLALADPDSQSIALAVASDTDAGNVAIPDWGYEAAAQPINISSSSSPAAIASYSAALTDIINQHFVSTNLTSIVDSDNPDPTQIAAVAPQLQMALGDVLALQVPSPLSDFQKSMVTMLVYEKNALALVANANNDPVKTALVLQGEQDSYEAAIQNMQTELQKASSLNGFSFEATEGSQETSAVAFLDSALGIQTAHAQWLTFDSANFGEWLWKFAQDLALQIVKNTLVTLVQRKVLAWVQGSGAPRFVTQWGTSLINAYTQAALNAINANMQCVYGPFQQQSRLDLGLYFGTQSNNICANTFQAALGGKNFSQFYNNFKAGGMIAFQASLLPSGNQFGTDLFNAQTVGLTGQNSQTSVAAKLTSSQGLTGDQLCTDGSNPGGIHQSCIASDGTPYYPPCAPGDKQVAQANNGMCANGSEPKTTTPGVFTGFGVNSALDSSPKLLTAANSLAGLLNAVLSSLLTTLAQTAISAANSAVNGGISSISQSQIQGGGTPPPPIPLGCAPATQTVSTTITVSIGATGGTADAQGNQPTYYWSSSDGASSTGFVFSHAYSTPGTYTITLSDNASDTPITCNAIIQ